MHIPGCPNQLLVSANVYLANVITASRCLNVFKEVEDVDLRESFLSNMHNEVVGLISGPRAFMGAVCMVSLRLCGFSLGYPENDTLWA